MTPFRYQSREGGGIITIYAATQDEADELRRRGYEVEAKKVVKRFDSDNQIAMF